MEINMASVKNLLGKIFSRKKISFKNRLITSLAVNFGLVFSVFVFIPMETYLGNTSEFVFPFSSLVTSLLWIAVPLFVILTAIEIIFNGFLYRLITAAVAGGTLACYAQGMFLNGMMKSLDGAADTYTAKQKLINLALWGIICLIPVVIALVWKKISQNLNRFICLAIAVMQIVGLVSLIPTYTPNEIEQMPTYDKIYDLADGKNVVLLILDRFDTENIDAILEEDPTYLDKFKGFTYYPNMVGAYVYTQNSLPYLITGVEDPDLYITPDEKRYNIENSEFLSRIDSLTDSMTIYTERRYFEVTAENIGSVAENVQAAAPVLDSKGAFKHLIKMSLYRVAPLFIKSRFMYTSADLNGATYTEEGADVYHCEDHKYDVIFKEGLEEQGLTIDTSINSSYKLIHFQGAHFPYNITENGEYSAEETDRITASKGSLTVAYEYLEQLKKVGKYEDTAIFIFADHGETILVQELETHTKPNANPIMFYKPAGVGEDEEFKISEAPISQKNLFPTIIAELGGDYSDIGAGRTITEIKEDEQITREFYYSVRDFSYEEATYFPHKYIIEGDSRLAESWIYVGPVPVD